MISTGLEQQRLATIERTAQLIPRHMLAQYPTPLMPARQMMLAPQRTRLWFKRDDLISFGLGGNKVRGLEVMLADALKQDADTLITGAGVQSNHVRATAFVAAYAGMKSVTVYWGIPPTLVDGNYRVTQMLGAEIRFTGDNDRMAVDAHIQQIAAELRDQGRCPYPIPRGGACAMGVLGHVLAVFELYRQCLKLDMEPDTIIITLGSGGTYAGWLIGTRLLNLPWKLVCYTVSREPDQVSRQVAALAVEASKLLRLDWNISTSDVPVQGGFIGPGYGIPSPEGAEAIKIVAKTEGILLDPVYTGKTMAGFLEGCRNGRFADCKNIVFLHTGGEPAFFAGDGDWLMAGNPVL